jgi:hypothetical protein
MTTLVDASNAAGSKKMGVFIMTTAMTFLTIGSLVFTIIMMKFKADLRFQTVMKNVWKTRIIKPIVEWWKNTAW